MKVLIVTPHFPPRHVGGVEIYTKRLADFLSARGDRAEVICVERIGSDVARFQAVTDMELGYPVHRLHMNSSTEADPFRASYHSETVQRWTEDFLERSSPDVVHVHSGYLLGGAVLAAALRCRVPSVVTLHDFWFVCPRITLLHPSGLRCTGPDCSAKCAWCLATEKRRYRLPDRLTGGRLGRTVIRALETRSIATLAGWARDIGSITERSKALFMALDQVDLVLSPSRFLRDLMISSGMSADRILLARLGITPPVFRPRNQSNHQGLRIGYLSQLAPHKGANVLIEALRLLPGAPIEARIYGDPQPHAAYTSRLKRISHSDTRVVFCGAYDHREIYDTLAPLDVVVVPSLWYENSPLVIQEAQAAHVPVVASRLGGMRELVNDEANGLLFEPGNPHDLARQLRRLLDDPRLLEQLQSGDTSVRTVEDEMRELSAHYQRLCSA